MILDEEMKEHFELLSQQWPRPKPCVKCYYWSLIGPCCNYLEEEGVLRDCLPDLKKHLRKI